MDLQDRKNFLRENENSHRKRNGADRENSWSSLCDKSKEAWRRGLLGIFFHYIIRKRKKIEKDKV